MAKNLFILIFVIDPIEKEICKEISSFCVYIFWNVSLPWSFMEMQRDEFLTAGFLKFPRCQRGSTQTVGAAAAPEHCLRLSRQHPHRIILTVCRPMLQTSHAALLTESALFLCVLLLLCACLKRRESVECIPHCSRSPLIYSAVLALHVKIPVIYSQRAVMRATFKCELLHCAVKRLWNGQ